MSVYQRMVAAYRDPDRTTGRRALTTLIETLTKDVPAQLLELTRLGRTLSQRAVDVLAYSTGPARPTVRPRRSAAGWSTCAAQLLAAGT